MVCIHEQQSYTRLKSRVAVDQFALDHLFGGNSPGRLFQTVQSDTK